MNLRWEGDNDEQWLMVGTVDYPVARILRRRTWWSATINLPGICPAKQYATIEDHKSDIEMRVERWFYDALRDQPATSDPSAE